MRRLTYTIGKEEYATLGAAIEASRSLGLPYKEKLSRVIDRKPIDVADVRTKLKKMKEIREKRQNA